MPAEEENPFTPPRVSDGVRARDTAIASSDSVEFIGNWTEAEYTALVMSGRCPLHDRFSFGAELFSVLVLFPLGLVAGPWGLVPPAFVAMAWLLTLRRSPFVCRFRYRSNAALRAPVEVLFTRDGISCRRGSTNVLHLWHDVSAMDEDAFGLVVRGPAGLVIVALPHRLLRREHLDTIRTLATSAGALALAPAASAAGVHGPA